MHGDTVPKRLRAPGLQGLARCAMGVVTAACLSFGLSACNWDDDGSGQSDTTPVALSLVADRATVNSIVPSAIDVLANDRASRGSLRLVGVGTPEHGRAELVGGKVLYHPQPGYLGTDRLTYSVQAEDGTVVAVGRVDLVVRAELVLVGQAAAGAALGGARVRVHIGETRHDTVADAEGLWRLLVVFDEPADMVRIEAVGPGARDHVRLVSLVGHAAVLLAAASTDGKVAAAELAVTHLSTAQAGMVERLLGRAPVSQAEWLSARARLFGYDILSLGEAIHGVASGSSFLPWDIADTWELARRWDGPQWAPPEALSGARALPLPLQPLPQRWLVSADLFGCNRETAEWQHSNLVCLNAVDLDLRAGGLATVVDTQGSRSARWREEDGRLTVTYDDPVRYAQSGLLVHPVTFESVPAAHEDLGFVLRIPLQGHVRMSSIVRLVYLDGSPNPYNVLIGDSDSTGALMRLVTDRSTAVMAADDFAVDRRWAGILGGDGFADVLRVVAAGRGVAERSGTNFDFTVDGPTLSLRGDDGSVRDYLRVSPADDLEIQHWVMYDRAGPVTVRPLVLVALETALSMSEADFSRAWKGHRRVATSDYEPNYNLLADGRARTYDDDYVVEQTWRWDSDGTATIADEGSGFVQYRRWQPLRRVGNTVFMMIGSAAAAAEAGVPPQFTSWYLSAFDDVGAPYDRPEEW